MISEYMDIFVYIVFLAPVGLMGFYGIRSIITSYTKAKTGYKHLHQRLQSLENKNKSNEVYFRRYFDRTSHLEANYSELHEQLLDISILIESSELSSLRNECDDIKQSIAQINQKILRLEKNIDLVMAI